MCKGSVQDLKILGLMVCCPLTLGGNTNVVSQVWHAFYTSKYLVTRYLPNRGREEGAGTAVATLSGNNCVGCIMNKIIGQMGKSQTEGEDTKWKGS